MGALSKMEIYKDEYLELMVLRGAIFSIEKHLMEKEINRDAIISILNFAREEVKNARADRESLGFGFLLETI